MKGMMFGLLALLPVSVWAQGASPVCQWKVVQNKTTIGWAVLYSGNEVKGTFPDYTSQIFFDPEHLENSKAIVTVETKTVQSSDHDAAENLPTYEWLESKKYPKAVFKSDSFRHIKVNKYEMDGGLTMREKTFGVHMPFTLNINKNHAVADGEAAINRLDFGIGKGDWTKTDAVAAEVKIILHLEADKVCN